MVSNKPGPGRNGLHSVTVIFVIEKKSNNYEIAVETPRSGLFAIANVAQGHGRRRRRRRRPRLSHALSPSALGARVLAAVTSRQRLTRRHPPRHPADEESEKWTVLIRLGRSWHMMGFKRDVPKR